MSGISVSTSTADTWWERLLSNLRGLSPTAVDVLTRDSSLLVASVLPRSGAGVATDVYPPERIRTGIVVGSVQSGKTASMLALAARCLDAGVDILVLLAGTRVALWLQTYERVLRQLDGTTAETAYKGAKRRVLIPDPADLLGETRATPAQYLRSQRRAMERAIREGRPIILIVPKEDDHLIELARVLRSIVTPAATASRTKPIELVVLDDEADDASVMDASEPMKTTPRLIQQLWSTSSVNSSTWLPSLYANYVAYTATPQANFAQASHNPLSPRHFRFVLRTPDQSGAVEPRELSYAEPQGIRSFYTGGRTFYERLRGLIGDFCVSYRFEPKRDAESEVEFVARLRAQRWSILGDALRSYFVSGAIRLYLSRQRFSQITPTPMPLAERRAQLPPTHSMLYHPSASKEAHFAGAEDISRWSGAVPGAEDTASPLLDAGSRFILSAEGLAQRLDLEEDLWRAWVAHFSSTATALRLMPEGSYPRLEEIPWTTLKDLLMTEVFPSTKIRVINSDPAADDRPDFEPRSTPGGYLAPSEIYSIFVAGNVMSRGLTVEGLSTTVFLRGASEPAADTQMQMQRWFGYRGPHLPLCRVFVFQDQLELFRAYHSNDEALKQDILRGQINVSEVMVLEGESFVATSKVSTRQAPLHPGPTPTIRVVEHEHPTFIQHNLDLVANLLDAAEFVPLSAPQGTLRGLISSAPRSLLDVADMLDGLRYAVHDPDPTIPINARWQALQLRLDIADPLFRPPGHVPGNSVVDSAGCPYSIAAYLRLWDALLSRRQAPGLYPTDRSNLSWHLIDLIDYQQTRPQFYVGIRFGEGDVVTHPRLGARGVRTVTRGMAEGREHMLETLWGTRGSSKNYFGDQLFDYHLHGKQPVPSLRDGAIWRPRGHPGLVLFHIVRHELKNVNLVAVGLGLPHGGPDQIAALRGTGS